MEIRKDLKLTLLPMDILLSGAMMDGLLAIRPPSDGAMESLLPPAPPSGGTDNRVDFFCTTNTKLFVQYWKASIRQIKCL